MLHPPWLPTPFPPTPMPYAPAAMPHPLPTKMPQPGIICRTGLMQDFHKESDMQGCWEQTIPASRRGRLDTARPPRKTPNNKQTRGHQFSNNKQTLLNNKPNHSQKCWFFTSFRRAHNSCSKNNSFCRRFCLLAKLLSLLAKTPIPKYTVFT